MTRRLLIVVILVMMRKHTFFQGSFLLIMSWVSLIYLVVTQPYKDRQTNIVETFNEGCIFVCCHITNSFLNAEVSPLFRSTMGWALIGVVGLNISFNLCLVGYLTLFDIGKSLKSKYDQI